MIRVETLTIQEFRGIRNLVVDFRGKNFAICGPNGTGKSGIVDALEFALTGNVSRLSGKGTGAVSVKDHGPHVDSRDKPSVSKVTLTGTIASTGKKLTIQRTVKNASTPTITPNEPAVAAVLKHLASHPEFALSRRELIRYVVSAPGDRAKEIQALLKLDRVETVRVTLQKIANSSEKQLEPLRREKNEAQAQLVRALAITHLDQASILKVVNAQRGLLSLAPILSLLPTTSIKDGLSTAAIPASRVSKSAALADIASLQAALCALGPPEADSSTLLDDLKELSRDPIVSTGIARERLLQSALETFDDESCPVCGTSWHPTKFRAVVAEKLKEFADAAQRRSAAEKSLLPVLTNLERLVEALRSIEGHAKALTDDVKAFLDVSLLARKAATSLRNFLPLSDTIAALQGLSDIPSQVEACLKALEGAVARLPEPTQQDAARDFLTIGQEKLENYRAVSLRLKQLEERATLARKISDTYAAVSTEELNTIYRDVEKEFGDLYRFINREDESRFVARLAPSSGKLDLDVDFYGRGYFPPGAYHSEGHQDGMGLCLYLALMKHLLGTEFTFAVLDDVLMSVDAGHRREVCRLLKEKFPATQFVLTTHDQIWLRHMKTEGLVPSDGSLHFRTWHIDHGPTEWDDRDIWAEIEGDVARNEIRGAASLLRNYLEYVSTELCHRLRAPVEFRSDAQFNLGDLMPNAAKRFKDLLRDGQSAALSWGQNERAENLKLLSDAFQAAVASSNLEQWQINPAVHYNEWQNFQREDFAPVVATFKALVSMFACSDCGGFLYVVPERGPRDSLKCPCGKREINLKSASSARKAGQVF